MKLVVKICIFVLAAVALTHHLVQAQINCASINALSPCMRPADTVNATGQFICRRRFQQGVVQPVTLCIATDWGTAEDRCGCCNGNCPVVCGELCPNPTGAQGAPYGRYVYDWNSLVPSRLCVTQGRTLQLQQQNPNRWRCTQKDTWFFRSSENKEPKWIEEP